MKLYVFFLSVSLFSLNSQTKNEYFDGQLLTLKAGYHTEDEVQSAYGFTDGFSIDLNLDIPTGKGWYVFLNYDLSYAKEYIYYYQGFSENNIAIKSYSAGVKYRFIRNKTAPYIGAGFGGSSIHGDKMIAFNIKLGFEYSFNKNLVLISEAAYYGMSEFNVGGGRSNKMFQIKLGFGYVIKLPK